MMITSLNILIKLKIFQNFDILSGHHNLDKDIQNISILETPDFENYIIDNSLVLTTFYPIKNDTNAFKNLLDILSKRNSAGILIKLNRYIDVIPEEIIIVAKQLDLPLITLNYDVNLSSLFNSILSEMQNKDYSESSFDSDYSALLKQVYEKPTTETLISIVHKIQDIELLIHNLENQNTYSSSKELNSFFRQYKITSNVFQRIEDTLYYSEDVVYEGNPIYRFVFMANDDKRHMLHNYIEVFKLLIIIVHQKKVEDQLKQHQFLINFISNPTYEYTNEQLITMSKRFSWNLNFPIILLIATIKQNNKNAIEKIHADFIKKIIIDHLSLAPDEIKITQFNDQLLCLINVKKLEQIDLKIKHIHATITHKLKHRTLKFAYSNLIFDNAVIAKTYNLLSEGLAHIELRNIPNNVFGEESVQLLTVLKNIDYSTLKDYVNYKLKILIDYEKKYSTPLIYTLYTYIENQFNTTITAKKLFIHYNSVKYRLETIRQLGFIIESANDGFFELYFALYLYINF